MDDYKFCKFITQKKIICMCMHWDTIFTSHLLNESIHGYAMKDEEIYWIRTKDSTQDQQNFKKLYLITLTSSLSHPIKVCLESTWKKLCDFRIVWSIMMLPANHCSNSSNSLGSSISLSEFISTLVLKWSRGPLFRGGKRLDILYSLESRNRVIMTIKDI